MDIVPATFFFLFLLLVVGLLCGSIAARHGQFKFSLKTVFVVVTTLCVGLGVVSAFGDFTFTIVFWAMMICLPLANFIVVSVLVVSVTITDGRKRAKRIGWLIPLIGMALIDCGRLTSLPDGALSPVFIFYYPLAAITALLAGSACKHIFDQAYGPPTHPLAGNYRGLQVSAAETVSTTTSTTPVRQPAGHEQIDTEPDVYEIG